MTTEAADASRADTRTRILEAARTVLARDGYSATTMRAISQEAGVAVGLANYHFNSRRELLAEVIASSRDHFLGIAEERAPSAPGPETLRHTLELVRALVDLMPDWYRIGADLDAQAIRDEGLATVAVSNKRRGQADVRQYFEAVCRAFEVPVPADIDGISAALLAAFDGLAVRQLVDPDFDPVPAYRSLERMAIAILVPEASAVDGEWDLDPFSETALSPRQKGSR